jgi:septum formation protein
VTIPFVWLASASPRRTELLEQLRVAHRLLLADAGEDSEALEAERAGESAEDYVERVTRAKLAAALARRADRGLVIAPVLAADTTVVLDGHVIGKPRDDADARRTLGSLSGRSHRVLTSVAVADAGGAVAQRTSVTTVRFGAIDAEAIARYVASGEPRGKAGSYAIQGPAGAWIVELAGSPSGVMGLPLHETALLLRAVGVAAGP